MNYDVIIIGSGPGGYVAAIRASQLGLKVAVIEKSELGGVCLNWGCIPTKALLKSAQVFNYVKNAAAFGVAAEGAVTADFQAMVARSREVAAGMSKGIQFLFKKNEIEYIAGTARLLPGKKVEIESPEGSKSTVNASHIIIATGARSRDLPSMPKDGSKIIGYRKAMALEKQPKSMVIVGSGAIGSEFAYFYNSIGTQITLVEMLPNILPLEDEEVSKQMERSFKKSGIKVITSAVVEKVDTSGVGCLVTVATKKGDEIFETDIVLSAVGITPNIENIGLEETGIAVENGRIKVDSYYRTNIDGYYAIGDVIPGPALAHVASREGIVCAEAIAGKQPEPVDYGNIPACTYTVPEVASVGMSEKSAREAGYNIRIGKFPFTASGKASAAGSKEGFVKLIFDNKYGELLGAHLVGDNVTEMIAELVVARKLETTAAELINAIHPHPTMSEAIMEAAAAAYNEVIHI